MEQEVSTRVESISASYDEEISAEASEIEALRERISEIDAEIARIDAESVTLDDRSDAQVDGPGYIPLSPLLPTPVLLPYGFALQSWNIDPECASDFLQ